MHFYGNRFYEVKVLYTYYVLVLKIQTENLYYKCNIIVIFVQLSLLNVYDKLKRVDNNFDTSKKNCTIVRDYKICNTYVVKNKESLLPFKFPYRYILLRIYRKTM